MPLTIACLRCQGPIVVPDDVVEEMIIAGIPVSSSHEVCPRDKPEHEQPEYHLQVLIWRGTPGVTFDARNHDNLLVTVGGSVHAPSFSEGFAQITETLATQWQKVSDRKGIVDL